VGRFLLVFVSSFFLRFFVLFVEFWFGVISKRNAVLSGAPQRIPSPRELQYHTQSIMQNALIRKKLEEQRENFRKRQEQQGGVVAPNVAVGQPPANGTMASTTLASIVAGTVSMAPNNMTSSASIVNPSGPVAACIEKPGSVGVCVCVEALNGFSDNFFLFFFSLQRSHHPPSHSHPPRCCVK
jgi:hypothetical protein